VKALSILLASQLALALLTPAAADDTRLAEVDAFWSEVSRSVREGDFKAYAATCHPEAVLVTGAKALARWKQEFDDTKAGTRRSDVTFRFSQRLGDETTAHETGIFLYEFRIADGALTKEYIHFQALLVKREGGWKTLMEYQKAPATEAEWEALK
jgi:ketosteroid isomerase-like protein